MPKRKLKFRFEKGWYQTIRLIKEKRITRMGVGPLCKLFGKTRQAYYDHIRHLCYRDSQDDLALEMVRLVHRELPGLGMGEVPKLGHHLYLSWLRL